jgi:high-affinity Fe2+/Pb2+ permease
MDASGRDNSTLGTILTWLLVAAAALVALKLTVAVLGMVVGLAAFVLTFLPVLIVAWLVWMMVRRFNRRDSWDRA